MLDQTWFSAAAPITNSGGDGDHRRLVGATATVLDELYGHRADGNYVIEDHDVEPCQFLDEPVANS